MTGSALFSFSFQVLSRKDLPLLCDNNHCPLPTPTPGGCFTELILAASRPLDSGGQAIDGGAGADSPGHCRGQAAAGEIAAPGKAPRPTPGPERAPRSWERGGNQAGGACSFHGLPSRAPPPCPPKTHLPNAGPTPTRGRKSRRVPRSRWGCGGRGALLPIGASLIPISHQLPPRTPCAAKSLCCPQNPAEFGRRRHRC